MAWPNSQKRRVEQVIQNGVVAGSGTHTDFVCMILEANLPSEMFSSSDANRAQANGGDIRAALNSDGTSQIPIDVIQWETAGAGSSILIAVKLDVSTSANTSFWLAYNTTGTTSADAATATFGSENVYTECEMAGLTDGSAMTDRSGNHSLSSAGTPANTAGSPLENFTAFAGNDRLSNTDTTLKNILTTYDTTISFWTRFSAYALNPAAFAWEGTDDMVMYPADSRGIGVTEQRAFWRDLGGSAFITSAPNLAVNTWYLMHLTTRASNDHEFLVDGSSADTDAGTGTAGPFTTFFIGGFTATSQDLNGDLANVIVWKTARSNDWCNTEYANQNSPATFIVEGTPEDIGGAASTILLQMMMAS